MLRRQRLYQNFSRKKLLSLTVISQCPFSILNRLLIPSFLYVQKVFREDMIALDNLFVSSEKADLNKDREDVIAGKG